MKPPRYPAATLPLETLCRAVANAAAFHANMARAPRNRLDSEACGYHSAGDIG